MVWHVEDMNMGLSERINYQSMTKKRDMTGGIPSDYFSAAEFRVQSPGRCEATCMEM